MARRIKNKVALRDHLRPGLRILFVGINPGLRSAAVGHHFAGHSNRFWKLLYDSGMIDVPLSYQEDWRLPEWELGLTNVIARESSSIDSLDPDEYRAGFASLEAKLIRYQPRIVALLGVTIFRLLFPRWDSVDLGPTTEKVAGIPVFLLPNPSGRNAHYSYQAMLSAFRLLQREAGSLS